MSKSNCNLCLAANIRTINIMNTHLQTLYEKLANYKVSLNLSLWLCYICHTRLKQCHQLSQLAKQTCCFLTTGLLQTNIRLKSDRMGLVNLSRSTTSHFAVPSPANSSSVVEVLVKKEPLSTLGDLVFDDEGLEQYEDLGNTEDWHSDDNKEYTKEENLGNDNSRADLKDVARFKNKVEIEINTHSGTNDVAIKEEIVDKIKEEILEDDHLLNVATVPDTLLYTCHICSHMFSSMSLLRKHKITHNTTSRSNLKDKLCAGKKIVCPICGKYYADRRVLARHQKLHLAVRPFSCEICNKTFSRRDHYNKHAQTHPGLHLYTCQNCNTHFPNSAQLKAHECTPQQYDPASYSCDICNERFDRWDLYHAHKTDAHGILLFPEITIQKVSRGDPSKERDDSQIIAEKCHNTKISKTSVSSSNTKQNKKKMKNHSCDTCNTHYSNHYQLETHVLAKHKKVRYECDHCDKVFLRRGNLCLHMRTHAGERRYCCDVCGKTFTYKSSLNTHWRVHTGVKPYACDLCSKKFTAFGQLAEHKLVHTDVRAFSCEVCSKAFKRRRHLKKHMMSHTGEKPYTCDVCFKSFARNDNYTIHRRIHTGEKPFVCDVCGDTFSENRHLKKHKIIHE